MKFGDILKRIPLVNEFLSFYKFIMELLNSLASLAKNKTDALASEEILSALSKRGPEALDVLIEALEVEEDVHRRLIERIRRGTYVCGIYYYIHAYLI